MLSFDEDEVGTSYLACMLGASSAMSYGSSEGEERAKILAAVFGKRTSVVFDANAICDLFGKEGQSEANKELLA